MNATSQLEHARASLASAEIAITVERRTVVEQQLKDAVAAVRRIDDQITELGQSLAAARNEAAPLWEKRALVAKELYGLVDDPLALPAEIAAYNEKHDALEREYKALTQKIVEHSSPIARIQHELDNLKFDKGRAEVGVSDLLLAVAEARTGVRQRM